MILKYYLVFVLRGTTPLWCMCWLYVTIQIYNLLGEWNFNQHFPSYLEMSCLANEHNSAQLLISKELVRVAVKLCYMLTLMTHYNIFSYLYSSYIHSFT